MLDLPFTDRRLAIIRAMLALGLLPAWALAHAQASRSPAAFAQPLRLTRSVWPPYLVHQADGQHHGLDYEILSAMAAEAGCRLQWVDALPRRRRLLMLQAGEIDLIPAASPRAGPTPGLRFTRPYRDEVLSVMAVASRHGQPVPDGTASGLRSFAGLLETRTPLLLLNAGGLGAEFEAWRPRLQAAGLLLPFDSHDKGVGMLLRERAPLILGDRASLLALASAQGMELVLLPFGNSRAPVAFMLSAKSVGTDELRRLDQALLRLEARGVLSEIRRRYGLD